MSTAGRPRAVTPARVVAPVAVVLAVVVLVYLLASGGGSYMINARFLDAGQLVNGGAVQVAGRVVGTISGVTVTPNGQANVELSISDSSITPFHQGTRAVIRAVGQAGVANRYVDLTLGSGRERALASGSVLSTEQTTSIVNYDALLDSFGPSQRTNVEHLINDGAQLFSGSGARYFNGMLAELDPSLTQLNQFTGELASDKGEIDRVITAGKTAASAIASRRTDLVDAVQNTAISLRAIASERSALADSLTRAPAVFRQSGKTLRDAATALTALRPALREVPAAAGPLSGFLTRLNATLPIATPVVANLRQELPDLMATFAGLEPLAPLATKGLNSAAKALTVARPIVQAARYYGTDLLLGVFNGLAGVAAANYDRWGHYVRLEFAQPYQTTLGGPLATLLKAPLAPDLFNLRTGLTRRCPGGNVAPSPDGSSPWVIPGLCTPSNDIPLSVDSP